MKLDPVRTPTPAPGSEANAGIFPGVGSSVRSEILRSQGSGLGLRGSIALAGALLLGGCSKESPAPAPTTPAAVSGPAEPGPAAASGVPSPSSAPAAIPSGEPTAGNPAAPTSAPAPKPPQDPVTAAPPLPVRALAEFNRSSDSTQALRQAIEQSRSAVLAAIE